jgi:hypothetical protein
MSLKKTSKKVVKKLSSKKALKSVSPVKKISSKKTLKTKGSLKTKNSKGNTRAKVQPSMSINFAEGTDMRTALEEVMKGGSSRGEVAQRLAEMWKDTPTRTGKEKPVSTIINHVVRRAKMNGYDIEQTWKLVKVDEDAPDPTPRNSKKVTKSVSKKVASKKALRSGRKSGSVVSSKKAIKRRSKA